MASATNFSANELFDLKHLLKCVSFLRDLSPKQLEDLVSSVECVDYASGDKIIETGKETEPALYMIRTGYVWLRRDGEDPVKLLNGCHFGEDMLDAAQGMDDSFMLRGPYNITAENNSPSRPVQFARLTLKACRKVFNIDNVDKSDSMYIRRKSKNKNPFSESSRRTSTGNSGPKAVSMAALAEEEDDDDDGEGGRKSKHKKEKKKKKDHDSIKKKKKRESTKIKLATESDDSSTFTDEPPSSHDSVAPRSRGNQPQNHPFILNDLADESDQEQEHLPEPQPEPEPEPEPEPVAPRPSFSDIRKNLQEKSKDQPGPLQFHAPAKSPRAFKSVPVKGSGISSAIESLRLEALAAAGEAPKEESRRGVSRRPSGETKHRSSAERRNSAHDNKGRSEKKHRDDEAKVKLEKKRTDDEPNDKREKKPRDESSKDKSEKKHRTEDPKTPKKKKPVDKHLHKARQGFDERSKKDRKEAKLEPGDDKPTRPPPNVFQKPLPLHLHYQAPEYPKSQDDEKTITRALSKAFPFKNMQKNNMDKLIAAFEPAHVGAGTEFVTPGAEEDYFYVVNRGKVVEEIDGEEVREVGEGEALGDMNLMHSTKNRMMSVRAKTDTDLFRVDQTTYRKILQTETAKEDRDKRKLLDKIVLFQNVSDRNKKKLCGVMESIEFKKGELMVSKEDYAKDFYIIKEGTVRCQDPDQASNTGRTVDGGGFFGETALVTGDVYPADVTAASNVVVYKVSRKLFEKVLGPVRHVIVSPVEARTLCSLEILRFDNFSDLRIEESNELVSRIEDRTYAKGEIILEAGDEVPGGLYFVRQGRVEVLKKVRQMIVPGGVFGDDLFEQSKTSKRQTGKSKFTIVAMEKTVCGVLKISDYRTIFKEHATPKAKAALLKAQKQASKEARQKSLTMQYVEKADQVDDSSGSESEDDAGHRQIAFHNLVKRLCLGEGNFGQVWMVYDKTEQPAQPYALKIQSKYQLVQEKQAQACIREKEAMAKLRHPNVIRLAGSFHDDNFVYMLLPMIQGGELFNLMHPVDGDSPDVALPEEQARFYAFVLADVLAYLHEQSYCYRDLKPENVLLDKDGYLVLIDFGFAKRLTEKTYTLCGTPGYLPPECCLSRGHTFSADHWSFGILLYEMICGESPFYTYGIDQEDLYRSIIEDDYDPPMYASLDACDLIDRLLVKDPLVRLGSLSGGESDILCHNWFKGLDSHSVRKRTIKAPWIPQLSKDPFDTSHFDDWSDLEDKTTEEYPELEPEEAALFDNF